MGGVQEVLQILRAAAVPMAVATTSRSAIFSIKAAPHPSIFDTFNGAIVLGDDPTVKAGKPAPDIFLEAARRIRVTNPGECLVIEDSPNGVRAGLAAGMKVAWIPDPALRSSDSVDLETNPNVTIYASLHDLASALPALLSI